VDGHSGNPPSYQALRTAHYTYVEYRDGQREYYDRETDPDQLRNLVATLPAATLARLHTTLTVLASCHGQAACTTAAQAP
jgi:N-acetylglucosamine-6-sulfatase